MINVSMLGLLAALLMNATAFAQATSTSTQAGEKSQKVGEVIQEDPSSKTDDRATPGKEEKDIDEEITNVRMRADSGSKSKWSLSSSLGYTGGSVDDPFGKERPNIQAYRVAMPGVQTNTSLDGSASIRYRANKNDSFTFGTSFGIMTPLHGDNTDPGQNQFNVWDPGVSYSRVFAGWGLQNVFSASGTVGTSNESRGVDRVGALGMSITTLKVFESGVTTGISLSTSRSFYDSKPGQNERGLARNADRSPNPDFYGGDVRTNWSLGIFPFAEYAFNDTWQLRTVFGMFNFRNLYGDDNSWRLLRVYDYQSIGVGYSLTRDIYIYPNVQIIPTDVRKELTNVAISATLNIF
jgi:hypothetical protein